MHAEPLLNEAQVAEIYAGISNWGRWGNDDQRGTINLIDRAAVLRGAGCVREGLSIGLALPIQNNAPVDRNRYPVQRHIFRAGDAVPETGFGSTWDFLGMVPHGISHTHIDALCHAFQNRLMYNGRPASDVMSTGARTNAVTAFGSSIASRGVLLDIPLLLGIDYLEPEQPVRREMLEAAEQRYGIRVMAGDILFVRTGRHVRYVKFGPGSEQRNGKSHLAGFYPDVLPFLRERDVAVLGSDGANEHLAFTYGTDDRPIHIGCLVKLGLPLIHNADLDTLAAELRVRDRADFLCALGFISFEGATSSPLTPVAIL